MIRNARERPARRRVSASRHGVRGIAALALLATVSALVPAAATVTSAGDFVQELMEEVLRCGRTAGASAPDVRIARFVDIEGMARSALGSAWAALDEAARESYLRAYRDLFQRTAVKICAKHDLSLTQVGTRYSGDTVIVAYRVREADGSQHDLYWYVRTVPRFAVVDVATDGVLVTEQLRREFETIIRDHDGDLTSLPAAIDRLQP